MPETTLLTDTRYKKLLTDLRQLLEEGRARAEQASGRILIETHWLVGKRLAEEKLTENAGYGESIVEDLAEDLGMDASGLRRSVFFYEAYKIHAPRGMKLTWSHYRELLALPNEEARAWYENQAVQEGWIRDELVQAIERDAFSLGQAPEKKKARTQLTRPAEPTYVYKALIERIVDADTLLLRIDLGFLVLKEQRVRLAGIDAAPLDDAQGYEAFEYVRDQLARVPFVMVKTHQIDLYGRYVGHVFYSFTEKDKDKIFQRGRYLNQELLDRGLAKIV